MNNSLFMNEDIFNMSDNDKILEISPCGKYSRVNDIIGEGASKTVYRGLDLINMKEIAYNTISTKNKKKEDKIRIGNEITILKNINHPNILNIIDVWYNKEKKEVIFITPLYSYNLKNFIDRYYLYIKIHHKIKWIKQIINGILYLHLKNIIHRDLKPDNIFINSDTSDILIADFGLSTKLLNSKSKANSCIGTPEYMAPELYSGDYDKSIDIYSFGMCLLYLFTNEHPYSECNNIMQIYKKVVNKIYPKSIEKIEDDRIKDIILKLIGDKESRPSINDIKIYFDEFLY